MSQHEKTDGRISYLSYVIGFIGSIVTTLLAYVFATQQLWSTEVLVIVIMSIAVVQLIVQMIFFLHIGHGSRWKAVSFAFTLLVVLIVVIGSIWVMYHLDYNMMNMTDEQMQLYMTENEGF